MKTIYTLTVERYSGGIKLLKKKDLIFCARRWLTPRRFEHSISAMYTASRLARRYKIDSYPVEIAALLHDWARDLSGSELLQKAQKFDIVIDDIEQEIPVLLHGPVACHMIRSRFNIKNKEILNSIYYHSTGRAEMSVNEKVVFLADCIEPDRCYPCYADLNRIIFTDLDRGLERAVKQTIIFHLENKKIIHPRSFNLWNTLRGCS